MKVGFMTHMPDITPQEMKNLLIEHTLCKDFTHGKLKFEKTQRIPHKLAHSVIEMHECIYFSPVIRRTGAKKSDAQKP